ncbi:hypothetical protein [Microbacterium sp. YJN-G]|uniref:hypothetical protein n=1 Tax=Microbacterium sp. YJN-G TaxID=2763257 RepID=UPI00187811FE|nr:hypothetical protein [Microbacterium sp. YJN-G]
MRRRKTISAVKSLIAPATTCLLAGAVLSALGVPSVFAWGWAVLAAAAALFIGMQLPDDARADAPGRALHREHVGSDVSRLAWAINLQTGTVNEAVTRRVRATLRRRLQRHGVDLDDERHGSEVEWLLGPGLWQRLNGRRTTTDDLRDALAAMERLVPATSPPLTTSPLTPSHTKDPA